ncbi:MULTISPECIES: hypothetical protein [unclassified Nonomuraea]|uniref:hypothetical protein n=1 Tax=unclassified Nonomuraea TaxID=2593643 RepID=UPI0033DD0F4C
MELAASAGLDLDPWQRYVLKGALGERADGRWSAFEVAVIVARQNGKGSIIEARELGGLYLFGSRLILHSAHEFKTAAEGFRRIMTLIDNTDDLRKRVKKVTNSHGEEGVELLNGARLRFVARSRGSGRGFSADDLILDEAYNLSPESVAAMLPTLSARPNPQIMYFSSAPLLDSLQLRALQARGRSAGDAKRLAYYEFSAPADADLDDPAAWAQANPALGIRLDPSFIATERDAMDDVSFARERLSIEEDPSAAGLIDMALWAELATRTPLADPVCLAIDTTPERSSTSVGAAGALQEVPGLRAVPRVDGLLGVDVIDNRPGTGWVVERVADLWKRHKPIAVVIDEKSAAAMFIQDLRNRGVRVETANTTGLAEATAQFYGRTLPDALTLRHPGHPALTAAVAGARKRDLGGDGAWAFTRRDVTVDVTPLISVTLAAWGHGRFKRKGAKPMIVYA